MVSAILAQLRLHQWTKNLLLLLPMLLAHQVTVWGHWVTLAAAMLAFSLTASAIYTVNDLADREADAQHPTKRKRPIPSGRLSPAFAVVLILTLLTGSAVVAALFTPMPFIIWLVVYVVTTTLYSTWLRRVVLLDVLLLGGLYSLRILAGGAAVDVAVSPWLLAFSLFLFSSLAFLKRYAELRDTVEREGRTVSGRGYHVGDADLVLILGPSLGFLAVLVFVLYLNSPEVVRLYAHPIRLWSMVPVMLYWVARFWLLAHRGQMHEDPVLFAVRDRGSYAVAAIAVAAVLWAQTP
jgi:4-hydroxybenzoate polyprenyltransferase